MRDHLRMKERLLDRVPRARKDLFAPAGKKPLSRLAMLLHQLFGARVETWGVMLVKTVDCDSVRRSCNPDRNCAPPRFVTLTGDADPVDSTKHDRLPNTQKKDNASAYERVVDSPGGFYRPFTQWRAQRWRHVELERRHSQGGIV